MSIVWRPARSLPWQLTDAAVEDWCDITKQDPQDVATFERANVQLAERMCEPLRFKRILNSGCELWRCVKKPRIYWVVDPRNRKVTLVRPEHKMRGLLR